MEEDVQYSTVVFTNRTNPQTAKRTEDKTPQSATEAPANDGNTVLEKKPANRALTLLTVLNLCLWLLLLGGVAAIIYLSLSLNQKSSVNQLLKSEMSILQNSTEHLTLESLRLQNQTAELQNLTLHLIQQREQLNWTLQVIMSYDEFPVNKLCPQKECARCPDGWIPFENSCYLFDDSASPWKTWTHSRRSCKKKSPISDLVIIDSLQEQEFIHGRTKYYHDKYHGFWIGLSEDKNNWIWVNGHNDSLRFWMEPPIGARGPKALLLPDQNVTTSWNPANDRMQNKFICESKALTID